MASPMLSEVSRCAYCAQPRNPNRLYIHFPLLCAVARDAGVELRMPSSDYFHGACGRRCYRKLMALDVELVPGARNVENNI